MHKNVYNYTYKYTYYCIYVYVYIATIYIYIYIYLYCNYSYIVSIYIYIIDMLQYHILWYLIAIVNSAWHLQGGRSCFCRTSASRARGMRSSSPGLRGSSRGPTQRFGSAFDWILGCWIPKDNIFRRYKCVWIIYFVYLIIWISREKKKHRYSNI